MSRSIRYKDSLPVSEIEMKNKCIYTGKRVKFNSRILIISLSLPAKVIFVFFFSTRENFKNLYTHETFSPTALTKIMADQKENLPPILGLTDAGNKKYDLLTEDELRKLKESECEILIHMTTHNSNAKFQSP